jgi:peptide/nickel transport system substrate-binding protein
MGYKNPTLDGILANASATTDQSQRASLYAQACKIIWDDAVGVFPAALTATYAVRSDVQNFTPVASTDPTFAGVTVSK